MRIKIRNIYKKAIAILVAPFFLVGCGKKADCKVLDNHVHKYVATTDKGVVSTYLRSEDLFRSLYDETQGKYVKYNWTDNYIKIDEKDIDFYKCKDLLIEGASNIEYLDSLMKRNQNYTEYHYYYSKKRIVTTSTGKFVQTYAIPNIHTGWTTDENHEGLDGQTREKKYMYYGYRIINKDGKWIRERSPLVDDYKEIIDEYPYFSLNCYELITKENEKANTK